MTSKKPESSITLVVRRGALRRFHKLRKDTENLPVVVTWDRRRDDGESGAPGADNPPAGDDRRKQMAFTWEMADFVVVPGERGSE